MIARMRGRLPRLSDLVAIAPEARTDTPAMLIVSSRHRLWQRYGPSGVDAVERALGELMDAMALRGLSATVLYPDDSPLLARFGVLPADTSRPGDMARVIRELSDRMRWTEERVRYLLLIGDEDILPHDRPANPSPDDEDRLRSDHLYATDAADPLRPARAVGRLPLGELHALVEAIRTAAQAHERLAAGLGAPLAPEAFGYSASVWKRAAREVFGTIGDPRLLRLSPPLTRQEAPRPGEAGPRWRYYNLHGLSDSPAWYGELDPAFPAGYASCPVALRPEDLAPAPGSLVFSAACFGAHASGRGTADSIALTSMAGGAWGFVGATGVSYGGLDGALVAGDLLAARFWQAALGGMPVGWALAQAKWALVQETLARQGYLDAEDEKAVLNMVLYGDPSLVCQSPSPWAEDAAKADSGSDPVEWAGQAPSVGMASVRPRFLRSRSTARLLPLAPAAGQTAPLLAAAQPRASATRQMVQQVQRVVARRLPLFGGEEVRIETSQAPRRAYAKSQALGLDGDCCPLIITLKKDVPTAGGGACHEVLRVTVDSRGAIRKLAVSH